MSSWLARLVDRLWTRIDDSLSSLSIVPDALLESIGREREEAEVVGNIGRRCPRLHPMFPIREEISFDS